MTTHATFTYVMTYVRIVFIMVLSMLFVFVIPFLGLEARDVLLENVVHMGILYAIIVGFLMSIAIQRKQTLDHDISLELNKIRRMYHLGLHLAREESRLEPWFTELKEHLHAYLGMFREVSFQVYERGSDLFRSVTYTVYRLPADHTPYNRELYLSLLDATATVTEAREDIRSKKDQTIGYFQWLVILVVTLTFSWLITSAVPPSPNARIVAAIIVFNLFLVLDLLYEYDRFNDKKLRYIADKYATNLDHLEELRPSSRAQGKKKGGR
ncbi:hypothetical protein KJZ71_04420 [Patescibacteria group bacterium]|uniref:DUF4239 domain-containing protein n=1 Tax=candidate division WWE3 bacterium TaxID=2053526 RepID=A0A928TRS0_UNCKA|nr:hypothetical protein [candidate division WWE3 bacterium]MCL4733016.1 hypothetical protein [Patescibacteria group bacterium]MDL1953289.1 hypothetical protein [Candidatus Uhrbacteria bacterium UHB]RIL00519.1 MAG: hypothetical protein DCC77_03070 [Candidatus Uhrbacteria bacterium]